MVAEPGKWRAKCLGQQLLDGLQREAQPLHLCPWYRPERALATLPSDWRRLWWECERRLSGAKRLRDHTENQFARSTLRGTIMNKNRSEEHTSELQSPL